MKMRILTLAGLLGLACTLMPGAVTTNQPKTAAGLGTGIHNLNSAGCKTCHAPHNGSSTGTGDTTGQYLLWATTISTQTYSTYTSAQMQGLGLTAPITGLGTAGLGSGTAASPDVKMYTLLCLSCHDGITTTFTGLPNGSGGMLPKNQVGSVASGGLTNDHPVDVEYNPSKDPGLVALATTTVGGVTTNVTTDIGGLPLYQNSVAGVATGPLTMQCSTCHDPHDNIVNGLMFLRTTNDSTHCLKCHK